MPTPIQITAGQTVLNAVLNDTTTARALAARLPMTVEGQRAEFDYCCIARTALETNPAELQDGWTNGDLLYGGGWFAILFAGQEQSKSYRDQMIVGHLEEGELARVRALGANESFTLSLR
ncbi:hypothetical protein SAMN05877809_106165 [Rhodobacter sp. JA431]|uniref:cyclophilin-like fold protein n=1 Tax=Rhodobacter sp. JA431 TaxID=570013 RepID=UPI000BD3C0FF|nr:cyclophilin-like fold protein [Rhodobacter sp. JA431]SOC12903.1 hypothetical protein SAMN05877809_106165 [Rhodobacter sp. JA431]